MKRLLLLVSIMSWLCLADTDSAKNSRIIENEDRIILVNPNAEKQIIKKENAKILMGKANVAKEAKDIAIPSEYNLQPVIRVEETVNFEHTEKLSLEILERSDSAEEKAAFYHNLKKNPGDAAPYEGTRDCVDTDNGATDPYGDGCAAYNNYPSWCGNYDDDDFDSNEMC